MQEIDVAIVGGGIAGLVTAVGLRGAGLRVAVFERDAILGGRARSWTDAKTGDPVHVGPHIFLSNYPNFLALLDRCGTADKIVREESGRFLTTLLPMLPAATRWIPLKRALRRLVELVEGA
jgi:15-cis-phytoene desaturase